MMLLLVYFFAFFMCNRYKVRLQLHFCATCTIRETDKEGLEYGRGLWMFTAYCSLIRLKAPKNVGLF